MNRVLIPLDGSVISEQALDEGLEQLPRRPAEVILLHCLDLNRLQTGGSGSAPMALNGLEQQSRRRKEIYLEHMVCNLAAQGYETRSLIVGGDPALGIVLAARELGVDLILMTTHGRGGAEHAVVGSVAEAVLRRANVPVLILPPSHRGHDQQKKAEVKLMPSLLSSRERQLA